MIVGLYGHSGTNLRKVYMSVNVMDGKLVSYDERPSD